MLQPGDGAAAIRRQPASAESGQRGVANSYFFFISLSHIEIH